MKKFLLLSAAFMAMSSAGFAQSANVNKPVKLEMSRTGLQKAVSKEVGVKVNAPIKKSVGNGVYYTRPVGSLYLGTTINNGEVGYIWNDYILSIPPFTNFILENKCVTPQRAVWSIGTTTIDPTQYPSMFTENNDLIWTLYPSSVYNPNDNEYQRGSFYSPTISANGISYYLGEEAKSERSEGGTFITDSINRVTFVASKNCWLFNGNPTRPDWTYPYGTGTYTLDDGTISKQSYVYQLFNKPMSPFWFDEIYILAITKTQAFKNGAKLTLSLTDVKTVVGEDGTEEKVPGDNVIATMTCGEMSNQSYNEGYTTGQLVFNEMTVDDLGTPIKKEFTLNDEFAITISGFEQDDIDCGIAGVNTQPEADWDMSYPCVTVLETGETLRYINSQQDPTPARQICLLPEFNGVFDAVQVLTNNGYSVIQISDDGQTNSTKDADPDDNLGGAPVYTAMAWYSQEGQANYSIENLPNWITEVVAHSDYRYMDGNEGLEILEFKARPLNGETGRSALVYVQGKGVTSAQPILLVQGNVDVSGIESTLAENAKQNANAPVYNLSGQRVSKDAKGILIQNGKKFMNNK